MSSVRTIWMKKPPEAVEDARTECDPRLEVPFPEEAHDRGGGRHRATDEPGEAQGEAEHRKRP